MSTAKRYYDSNKTAALTERETETERQRGGYRERDRESRETLFVEGQGQKAKNKTKTKNPETLDTDNDYHFHYHNHYTRDVIRIASCLAFVTLGFSSQIRILEGMYSVFLEDWFRIFTRDQVLVLRNEDYSEDVEGHIIKVFNFLDVGKCFSWSPSVWPERQW